jgi:hypothetical protein
VPFPMNALTVGKKTVIASLLVLIHPINSLMSM